MFSWFQRMIRGSIFLGLIGLNIAFASDLKWVCKVPSCQGCSLVVDLDQEQVAYRDQDAFYLLKQNLKSEEFRGFLLEPKEETQGFRALFARAPKLLTLYQIDSNKKEKLLFSGAVCERRRR